MENVEVKRKLREFKRLELKIRNGKMPLVWNVFFDLQESSIGKAKYTLKDLAGMSHDEFKHVIGEYWSFVYNKLVNESDIPGGMNYDTSILLQWGLPSDADADAIKKKFRELAKLSHPDTGGDERAFIALMEDYKKLTGR